MALTTTVSGIMTIGTSVKIPIRTTIPPARANEFEFAYAATDINAATKLPIGEFIT